MFFSTITLGGFRNLIDAKVDTCGKNIFLVGPNGQGKTNFLEAVYFCSYASSFRNAKDSEVICKGKEECFVRADFFDIYDKVLTVGIRDGKKVISLDDRNLLDRKELLSVVSSIVFCHGDLDFVSGTSERRRWFFDQNICLYDPLYLDALRRYKKILKSRNILLKQIIEGKNSGVLDVVDPQLAEYGLQLMKKREEEIDFFSDVFNSVYEKVSGISGIKVKYKQSWKSDSIDGVVTELRENRSKEIALGQTRTGPHRDNYIFIRNSTEYVNTASTGQKRLLALILRVAQALRCFEMTKKEPILLLDDVLLELDGEKRKNFLSFLPPYRQAFYTFLPEEPFEQYRNDNTIVYDVREGKLVYESDR
ncbi:MAG: DNA replication and repair protein RecF [Spirochaetaceae bacterium]|jgi:DNA replication and repair protein RecF|nr:DNA replication and repair protein RecF [Spirochaetaceae bacterium]